MPFYVIKGGKDKTKLIKKVITDKNGKRVTVWVKPGEDPHKVHAKKQEEAGKDKGKKTEAKNYKPLGANDKATIAKMTKLDNPKDFNEKVKRGNNDLKTLWKLSRDVKEGKSKLKGGDTDKDSKLIKDGGSKKSSKSEAGYSDTKRQMTRNLNAISSSITPTDIKGVTGEDTIKAVMEDVRRAVSSYAPYLAPEAVDLMHQYTNKIYDTIGGSDEFSMVQASDMRDMLVDNVKKIVHQEVESNRQQFTEHGVRHIVKNTLMQQDILDNLKQSGMKITNRERLLGIFAMTNHDIGYTAPKVRQGGIKAVKASGKHTEYSKKITEEQRKLWNENKIFTKEEYDRAVHIIETHDSTSLDASDPVALATRLADNLSLFHAEKLPAVFRHVEGGKKILTNMFETANAHAKARGKIAKGKAEKEFNKHKKDLVANINKAGISANLKRDLKAAVKEIGYLTPKFTIGVLAGESQGISSGRGSVLQMNVKYNSFDQFLQSNFDMGQAQTHKFLRDYGISDFSKTHYKLGEYKKKAILEIVVTGNAKMPKTETKKSFADGRKLLYISKPKSKVRADYVHAPDMLAKGQDRLVVETTTDALVDMLLVKGELVKSKRKKPVTTPRVETTTRPIERDYYNEAIMALEKPIRDRRYKFPEGSLREIITGYGDKVARHNKIHQTKYLGFSSPKLEDAVADEVDEFIDSNLGLFENVMAEYRAGEINMDAVANRIKLITTNEAQTLDGRLAMRRQIESGIERFKWDTMDDSSVRETHAGLHGKVYGWEKGAQLPDGRHIFPGQEIRCRCRPLPMVRVANKSEAGREVWMELTPAIANKHMMFKSLRENKNE